MDSTQSDVYLQLMDCLEDISTTMIEEEIQECQAEVISSPAIDGYIADFCLEHFGDDEPPSTEVCCPVTDVHVPDHLDDCIESLVFPRDLPELSVEEVDSACESIDYQSSLDGDCIDLCSSPDSGYSSRSSIASDSPDTSLQFDDLNADSAQSLDWTDLLGLPDHTGTAPVPAKCTDFSLHSLPHPPQHIPVHTPAYQPLSYTHKYQPSGFNYQVPVNASQPRVHSEPFRVPLPNTLPIDKPTDSYVAMISKAIMASKDGRLLLGDIYKYILEKYSYFRTAKNSWRNSVRHNLSTNACFIKCGRAKNGKGFYWGIHAACLEAFQTGDFDRRQARRQVQYSVSLRNHFTQPSSTSSVQLPVQQHNYMVVS